MKGGNIYALAKILGHSSPKMTIDRYAHLSPEFIERANLRVDLSRFRKELLRNERETLGRFDSRYVGVDPDAAGDSPEYDASDTAISGAFIGTMNAYLARDLNYQTNMPYRLSASEEDGFKWDWNHRAVKRERSSLLAIRG